MILSNFHFHQKVDLPALGKISVTFDPLTPIFYDGFTRFR
jgi:hypothetical protein